MDNLEDQIKAIATLHILEYRVVASYKKLRLDFHEYLEKVLSGEIQSHVNKYRQEIIGYIKEMIECKEILKLSTHEDVATIKRLQTFAHINNLDEITKKVLEKIKNTKPEERQGFADKDAIHLN